MGAHAAAARTLEHLYPQEVPGHFGALGRIRANMRSAAAESAWQQGEGAAADVIALALRDGSHRVWDPTTRPAAQAGKWRPAPPLDFANPVEPLAGAWVPWVTEDLDPVAPPPPVAYDSEEFWREAAEVLEVSRRLTAAQKRIADDWNLDVGSVTPAGMWNLKALGLGREAGLDEGRTLRLLAALNVAMADALIACWREKFRYWSIRPVSAIRDRLDPDFLPYLLTPVFPSYPSGHALVSGAAAEVLTAFLPEHSITLQGAAQEATKWRLYGGIHFESDNREGLEMGGRIGAIAARRSRGDGERSVVRAPASGPQRAGEAAMSPSSEAGNGCIATRIAVPRFETVASPRPTLTWEKVQGADRYLVSVSSRVPEGGIVFTVESYVQEAGFTPPQALAETTAIVDVAVQPVCGAQRGAKAQTTFFVDARLGCSAPRLEVQQTGGTVVRWDRVSPGELIEIRSFKVSDGSLRERLAVNGSEVRLGKDSGAPTIVAVRRKCGDGYSENAYVWVGSEIR